MKFGSGEKGESAVIHNKINNAPGESHHDKKHMNLKSNILGGENLDAPAYTQVEPVIHKEKSVTVKSSKVDTYKKK